MMQEASYNRLVSEIRIGVEHFFGRMSYFGAAREVFRHRRFRHTRVVRVVTNLVDQKIERYLRSQMVHA
jgi:hypothetical protein